MPQQTSLSAAARFLPRSRLSASRVSLFEHHRSSGSCIVGQIRSLRLPLSLLGSPQWLAFAVICPSVFTAAVPSVICTRFPILPARFPAAADTERRIIPFPGEMVFLQRVYHIPTAVTTLRTPSGRMAACRERISIRGPGRKSAVSPLISSWSGRPFRVYCIRTDVLLILKSR